MALLTFPWEGVRACPSRNGARELEFGPGDVVAIPLGHDGLVVGERVVW
jgi:hypothetical protein